MYSRPWRGTGKIVVYMTWPALIQPQIPNVFEAQMPLVLRETMAGLMTKLLTMAVMNHYAKDEVYNQIVLSSMRAERIRQGIQKATAKLGLTIWPAVNGEVFSYPLDSFQSFMFDILKWSVFPAEGPTSES